MSDENLSTPEQVSPEVSFWRGLVSRARQLLRDPKNKLTGASRLVAELLDLQPASRKILGGAADYEKLAQWQKQWDGLQLKMNSHTDLEARNEFMKQQEQLHAVEFGAEHSHGEILTIEDFQKKFELIRDSAHQAQQKIYRENIELARLFAQQAANILHEHCVGLEATQADLYKRYGLSYAPGSSPLVAAVKAAEKFVLNRVANDEGNGAPDQVLSWLIL